MEEHHITIKLIFSYTPKLKFSFSTDNYSEKPFIFCFGGISFSKVVMGMYGDPLLDNSE